MADYVITKFMPGDTIKHAVEILQDFKNKGVMAAGDFNGTILFSDTVTLDSAYIAITGKSYDKCIAEEQQRHDNYKKREQEYKNNLPKLIHNWLHKGEEILDKGMLDEWNRMVPIRANDIYHGMELDACLDIVKILNDGKPTEEAIKVFYDQGHSGWSGSLVREMVRQFAKRGNEFAELLK